VAALSAAAAKAERHDGAREAERFYARALELRGVDGAVATTLRIKRARAKVMLGDLSRAAADLSAGADDAQQLGRQDLRGEALVTLANIYLKQGRASDARSCIRDAHTIAQELDDRWLLVRTAYEMSALQGDFEGNVESAISVLRAAVRVASELDDLPVRLEGHLRIGNLLVNLGKLSDAERESSLAAELALPLGSNRDRARATYLLALVTFYRAGPEAARPIATRALKWTERVGDNYFHLQSLRALAKCEMTAGYPDIAEAHLREALPLAEQGGGWLVVEICRYLVEALVDLGRIEEAAGVAAQARVALPPEDDYAVAAALLGEALVSAGGIDPGGAWNSFAEAMRIMEGQQLWLDLGEAQILHARALARAGLRPQAEDELGKARALFEQLEADAMVTAIDGELARLALDAGVD
jgi:tetratricopeptide (TPR) repeat protein